MFRFIRVRIGMTRSFHLIHLFSFLLIQSTLLREERLPDPEPYIPTLEISIHAPARGATSRLLSLQASSHVFQSTLLREERLFLVTLLLIQITFQSTLLREERQMSCTAAVRPFPISIHAPARGATNSVYISNLYPLDFNPRSCERSDLVSRPDWIIDPISIHAPARGATFLMFSPLMRRNISIHAPARGATSLFCVGSGCIIISIHAPARGATKRGSR